MEELVSLLVEKVPAGERPKALREAGEEFGRRLAAAADLQPSRHVGAGLERVCDALGSLGFQVSVVEVEGDRAELASPTCPLRPLVVKCADARDIDQGMWAALVARALRGLTADQIRCRTPRCLSRDEHCQILLSLERRHTG
jgi:hypothetical protein